MVLAPIDVWDLQTFDPELVSLLNEKAKLIRDYLKIDRDIFLSHELGRGLGRSLIRPENPFALEYYALKEIVGAAMGQRTIRAFHYTRLTDREVETLLRDGIHVSTPKTLRSRFDQLVDSGELALDVADRLYAESPFHSDQLESRSDKFWMTSHPISVDDSGVTPLLQHWGGEVASMWMRDETLLARLKNLGQSRIIEVAVPLLATRQSYSAGEAVIATFARSNGSTPSKNAFDLYVHQPLPGAAILAVHTEGEGPFSKMGQSYPIGFVDVDIGRWNELTGDSD